MKNLFPTLFKTLSPTDFHCETCILAKNHRVNFPISSNKSFIPFALIHFDVWGPAPISSSSGYRWFVTFINDCTRMTWLYLLKKKFEVLEAFRSFHVMVQTQFSASIQILRSENGGEFINKNFQEYFKCHGLLHETTSPQTPQNGVAERKNRHILETAWSLLIRAHVPPSHWAEVVTTTIYLINRMLSWVLQFSTPLHALSIHTLLPSILMLPPKVFWLCGICAPS